MATPSFPPPPAAAVNYDATAGEYFVSYSAARASYSVTQSSGSYVITSKVGSAGSDTFALGAVDRIKFSDETVNLKVQSNAASIATTDLNSITELYTAYFNRVPDADGLNYWIGRFKGGMSLNAIGDSFYAAAVSASYTDLTGYSSAMSNADFVIKIYQNVLNRTVTASDGGVSYWANSMANGVGRGSVVNQIILAAHTYKGDPSFGWVADLLDNKLSVAKTFAISDGLTYITPADSITHGMQITTAVTATDTTHAIQLIGVTDPALAVST